MACMDDVVGTWLSDDPAVLEAREQLLRALAKVLEDARLNPTPRQEPRTPSRPITAEPCRQPPTGIQSLAQRSSADLGARAEALPANQRQSTPSEPPVAPFCQTPAATLPAPHLVPEGTNHHPAPAAQPAEAPGPAAPQPLQGAWASRGNTGSRHAALANRLVGAAPSQAAFRQGNAPSTHPPGTATHAVVSQSLDHTHSLTSQHKAAPNAIRVLRVSTPPTDNDPHATSDKPIRRILPAPVQPSQALATNPWLKRGESILNTALPTNSATLKSTPQTSAATAPASITATQPPSSSTPISISSAPQQPGTPVNTIAPAATHEPIPPPQQTEHNLPPQTPCTPPVTRSESKTCAMETPGTDACCITPAPKGQNQGQGTVPGTQQANPWTPLHSQLVFIHATLLTHGHCHESIPHDTMKLVTLLVKLAPVQALNSQAGMPALGPDPSASPITPMVNLGRGLQSVEHLQHHLTQLMSIIETRPWPLPLVKQYIAGVLDRCTTLVCGMGQRVRDLLCDLPGIHASCPSLAARLDSAQVSANESSKHTLRLPVKGLSATPQQSMPMSSAHPDGQRRRANQERARDCLHALAKDANGLTTALQDPVAQTALTQELQRMGSGRPASTDRTSASGQYLQALLSIQKRMQDMLSALHPDNLSFVSELYTSCVLQAAATGQAVIEGAVASLAQQDPSRFARLSARMQPVDTVPQPPRRSSGPNRTLDAYRPRSNNNTRGGNSKGGSASLGDLDEVSSTPRNARFESGSGQGVHQQGLMGTAGTGHDIGGAPVQVGKEFVFASGERLVRAVTLLNEFEPVQRGFVLLCELSDSWAFSNALGRCMASRLNAALAALPGWPGQESTSPVTAEAVSLSGCSVGVGDSNGPLLSELSHGSMGGMRTPQQALGRPSPQQQRSLQERLTSIITLSNYLSYLTHAHQPASTQDMADASATTTTTGGSPWHDPSDSPREHLWPAGSTGAGGQHGVVWPGSTACTQPLLRAALTEGMLPLLMPCVSHLLWHVHLDPDVLHATALTGQPRPQAAVHVTLQALWRLHQHPDLQPHSPTYGVAAMAVRTLIDDVFRRVADAAGCQPQQLHLLWGAAPRCESPIMPGSNSGSMMQKLMAGDCGGGGAGSTTRPSPPTCIPSMWRPGSGTRSMTIVSPAATILLPGSTGRCGLGASHSVPRNLGLSRWDHLVDTWLLELCCPGLDANCRQLQRLLTTAIASQGGGTPLPSSATGTPFRPTLPGQAMTPPPSIRVGLGADPTSSAGKPATHMNMFSPGGSDRTAAQPRKVSAVRLRGPARRSARAALALQPPSALLPPSWAALLPGGEGVGGSNASQLLREALVSQYSGDDQVVKLKDVMTTLSELVTANACALAMAQAVMPALPKALEKLTTAATAAAARLPPRTSTATSVSTTQHTSSQPAAPAGAACPAQAAQQSGPGAPSDPSDGLLKRVSDCPGLGSGGSSSQDVAHSELFTPVELEACSSRVSEAVQDVVLAVVRGALVHAERTCREHVGRAVPAALGALLPVSWPTSVHGCATALTEQMVLATAAQRLVQQVPSLVLNHLEQHVEPLAKTALKQARQAHTQQPAAQQQESTVRQPPPPASHAHSSSTTAKSPALPGKAACAPAGHVLPGVHDEVQPDDSAHASCWVEAIPSRESVEEGDPLNGVVEVVNECAGCGQRGTGGMASCAAVPLPAVGHRQMLVPELAQLLMDWVSLEVGRGDGSGDTEGGHAAEGLKRPAALEGVYALASVLGRELIVEVEPLADDKANSAPVQLCAPCTARQLAKYLHNSGGDGSSEMPALLRLLHELLNAASAALVSSPGGSRTYSLKAVAHLLAYTLVCLFQRLIGTCRPVWSIWSSGNDEARHGDALAKDQELIAELLQLPSKVVTAGAEISSHGIVHSIRTALQAATLELGSASTLSTRFGYGAGGMPPSREI